MASIEEMIKSSTCFGLAYSPTVRECKICEVKLKCESKCKMAGATSKPATVVMADKDEVSTSDEAVEKSTVKEVEANEAAKSKPTKKKKAEVEYSSDMPEFKSMSIDEIEALLAERGGNPSDFDKYTNASIKKMRMVMALKKTYELK